MIPPHRSPEVSCYVKMIVPPIVQRREIDRKLVDFFRSHRTASFTRAVSALCRFYGVKRPRIRWFEYLDWGKSGGQTFDDGRIHLVHPENWKRGRVYNSERMWVQMIYHEMAHFLYWTDAERKADLFSRRMVTGLRTAARRNGRSARRALTRAHRFSRRLSAGPRRVAAPSRVRLRRRVVAPRRATKSRR